MAGFESILLYVKNNLFLISYITGIATVLGFFLSWQIKQQERRNLKFVEISNNETHTIELFKALSDSRQTLHLAAAALLFEKAKKLGGQKKPSAERHVILQGLIGATLVDSRAGPEASATHYLCKFIADNIIGVLGARTDRGLKSKSPLVGLDWQHSRMRNAYWADVDARGVDFFRATLDHVSLRRAHLQDATLLKASLKNSVLCGANLTGADLREADLRGADFRPDNSRPTVLQDTKFDGALYDAFTQFPPGFDPSAHSMVAHESNQT